MFSINFRYMENIYEEKVKSSVPFGLSIEENYIKRVRYEMAKNKII